MHKQSLELRRAVEWVRTWNGEKKQEEMKVKFKTCLKELFDLIYQKNVGLKADILLPATNIHASPPSGKAVYPRNIDRNFSVTLNGKSHYCKI